MTETYKDQEPTLAVIRAKLNVASSGDTSSKFNRAKARLSPTPGSEDIPPLNTKPRGQTRSSLLTDELVKSDTVIGGGGSVMGEEVPPGPASNIEEDAKCKVLTAVTEEILTLCHLLENSRARALEESYGLRDTIRELEQLLDSARLREVNHLSYVEQQREAMATFEKRYYNLKNRARTHIKAAQDERDTLRKALDETEQRLKKTESELSSAQSALNSQTIGFERLKEQVKSMPSEKELIQMRLKLRRLEDENGQLALERARWLDTVGSKTGTALPSTKQSDNKDVEALENRLQKLQKERDEFESYCRFLINIVPPNE